MKNIIYLLIILSYHNISSAQGSEPAERTQASAPVLPQASNENGLFDTDDILQITLRGCLSKLLRDRAGIAKKYPLILSYSKEDGSEYAIPVEVKTRGHFRRMKGICSYPPLLIDFPKEGPHLSSVFRQQKKLKLVMPCKDDNYVIREWLVYKLYNLITPRSFKVRLVKLHLVDEDKKKENTSFYGILIEEEKQMAKRNRMVSVKRKLKPAQIQKDAFLSMAVFQYLIGNTDWSIQYRQNIKLMAADSNAVPVAVPYDFDHSGIVNAPYAKPAEELQMRSIRERRYRGYCSHDMQAFESTIAQYNRLKPDIYRLYSECGLLDEKYIKSTLEFLDEFYETMNHPKTWQKEFAYPCDPNGTGNVVIKGLKEG